LLNLSKEFGVFDEAAFGIFALQVNDVALTGMCKQSGNEAQRNGFDCAESNECNL
jgi:hypothetical protein